MDWTPERLTEFATGYWAPGALIAAVELGIFETLSERPMSAELIAEALPEAVVAEPPIAALLDALTALQLLDKTGDGYVVTPSARPLLDPAVPGNMLDALTYNGDVSRDWSQLSAYLAGARKSLQERNQPDVLRRFVYGMESKAQALAPALAKNIDLAGARNLLDVGAGPGTLSRRLAEQYHNLSVTLLDKPEVLEIARDICTSSTAVPRLTYHPADYHTERLPTGFDIVLFAGALHQEPPDTATCLMCEFVNVLNDGGTVYVIDIFLNDDRISPLFATLFQLNMLISQPNARVYSTGEVHTLLSNAGFTSIETIEIPQSIYRIVKARKPENA